MLSRRFYFSNWPFVKLKECKKIEKFLGLAKELEKCVEYEGDGDTVAERKYFKLSFSAGIILAVSILYYRPLRMI